MVSSFMFLLILVIFYVSLASENRLHHYLVYFSFTVGIVMSPLSGRLRKASTSNQRSLVCIASKIKTNPILFSSVILVFNYIGVALQFNSVLTVIS